MPAPTESPGEFYQLDFEMSFVTQDDVFNAIEPVLSGVFEEFAERPQRHSGGRISAHSLQGGAAEIRQRQAGPAQSAADQRRRRAFQRLGLRPVRGAGRKGRGGPRGPRAEHRREEPQVLRRHERMGAGRGLRRPWLRHAQGRRMGRPDRQEPRRRGHGPARRRDGPWPRRRHLLRRRQGRGSGQARGRRADPRRRAARPDRGGRVPLLLDRRFPDVRI